MVNLKEASGMILAYLGDAVWELYVRRYAILKGFNNNKANKVVKTLVNAKIQSKILNEILSELSEKEREIVKRGKNANIKSFPNSCTVMEYRNATGFEALIGTFYELGEVERIENIIKKAERLIIK